MLLPDLTIPSAPLTWVGAPHQCLLEKMVILLPSLCTDVFANSKIDGFVGISKAPPFNNVGKLGLKTTQASRTVSVAATATAVTSFNFSFPELLLPAIEEVEYSFVAASGSQPWVHRRSTQGPLHGGRSTRADPRWLLHEGRSTR